ncbi:MAG: chemotaxis protein CheW [bacterium]
MAEEKRINDLQLVVFRLSDEEYAIPIIQVHEIIKPTDVTRIPGMPEFVEGVINLRGKVIPIIDIRKRFRLGIKKQTEDTRVVVVDVDIQVVGLIVDSVTEVLRIPSESIDPVPATISRISSEYLSGIGKLRGRLLIILDVGRMLTDLEKVSLEQAKEVITDAQRKPDNDSSDDKEEKPERDRKKEGNKP